MFIATTLGGLVLAVSVSMLVGTVAGALIRPRIDRACDRVVDSFTRIVLRARDPGETTPGHRSKVA